MRPIVLAFSVLLLDAALSGQTTLATFNLKETLGVNHPDQPIEFRYDGGFPAKATTRMLGPNGQEVAYQWVASCKDATAVKGCIAVRSNLPNSMINLEWTAQSVNTSTDTLSLAGPYLDPPAGDLVQFNGTATPGGLTAGVDFCLYNVIPSGGQTNTAQFKSADCSSSVVDITSVGTAPHAQQQGFRRSGNTLVAPQHHFVNGNKLQVCSTGSLPAPLACNTDYYVVNKSGSAFSLASTYGGSAITFTTSGSGIMSWTVDWTWTLQTGVAPTVTPMNPVVVAVNGNNWEITNGRTGIRVPTMAGNTTPFNKAPIQGIRLADGTWTGRGAAANLLYDTGDGSVNTSQNFDTATTFASGYTTAFTEAGPLKTTFRVTYTFNRPKYFLASNTITAVDTTANTITLANPMAKDDGQDITFVLNGGGLPSPLTQSTPVYTTHLVAGTASTYTLTQDGTPIDLDAGFSGSPLGRPVVFRVGTGTATFTYTLWADSKSILIGDDDDGMQFRYFVPIYTEVTPDRARYRGHSAASVACGYYGPFTVSDATNTSPIIITTNSVQNIENGNQVTITGVAGNTAANITGYAKQTGQPVGSFALYSNSSLMTPVAGNGAYTGGGAMKAQYRGLATSVIPVQDAVYDINYTGNWAAGYQCAANTVRRLMIFNPAASVDAGWYWTMYNSAGSGSSPLLGIFTGRLSQQVYANSGPSMPGMYSSSSHFITSAQAAGWEIDTLMGSPDGSVRFGPMHREWGIYVSTQGDLGAVTAHQNISTEQNTLAGINLSTLYAWQTVYPDPVDGWKWAYLPTAGAESLIACVQNGAGGSCPTAMQCGTSSCYYDKLKASDSSAVGAALVDMWRTNTATGVQYAIDGAINYMQYVQDGNENGDGVYAGYHYYQIGLTTSPQGALLNAVLMNPNTTATQKLLAKAFLAFAGSIFWDNDWAPIDNASGDSFGLQNQYDQYLGYRAQYGTQLSSHPFLSTKFPKALSSVRSAFSTCYSSTGASLGSTHYDGACFVPLALNFLRLSLNNDISMVNFPNWLAHANWRLSVITPPEPRFGTARKCYSNGDGSTLACQFSDAMLANMLNSSSPATAQSLMGSWSASNGSNFTEDGTLVPTLAAIDPSITASLPTLGSVNIPGYHSVLRSAFGTANECAVFFINGDFYSTGGHRHYDSGQVSAYCHNAPIIIDWNANGGSPSTGGRWMHTSSIRDTSITGTWSDDNKSVMQASTLAGAAVNTEFSAFPDGSNSCATFSRSDATVWTRCVKLIHPNPARPIIFVSDTDTDTSPKTRTWNMMATGAVTSPSGSVTPTARFSAGCLSTPGELPSNGTVFDLGPGLQEFDFTGQTWTQNDAGGINWKLIFDSAVTTFQFLIGNWGHGCHTQREVDEFSAANGRVFDEKQHILRLHGTADSDVTILPVPKTSTATNSPTAQACGNQIVQSPETTCYDRDHFEYTDGSKQVLVTWATASKSAFGMTISGGPAACTINSGIMCTVQGVVSGELRTITLPAGYYPQQPTFFDESGNVLGYSEASALTLNFTSTPQTLRTIRMAAPAGNSLAKLKLASTVSSATPYLVGVAPGAALTLKAAPGAYEAQWVVDDMRGQVFSVIVQ